MTEIEKIEDREFQIEMLEYQKNYDTLNSVLTVTIAVGFSLALTIAAISYTSIGQPLRNYLTLISLGGVAVSAFSTWLLIRFHKKIFPKSLESIRRKFLEKKPKNDPSNGDDM
jgi:cytochrome c biogenesis protein CcdA